MPHHRIRIAGLAAILAALALALAPSALAAGPASASAATKAKERAYGTYCGPKRKGASRNSARAKRLDAMSKLATGASSSPSKACRGLSRKRANGERKSAFARCVSAGARLMRTAKRADRKGGSTDDGAGDDPSIDDSQAAADDPALDAGAADAPDPGADDVDPDDDDAEL